MLSVYGDQFCSRECKCPSAVLDYVVPSMVSDLLCSSGEAADSLQWNWVRSVRVQVGCVHVVQVQNVADSGSICSAVLCFFQMEKKKQGVRERRTVIKGQICFLQGRLATVLVPAVMCN
jgi:hypothetical protein